jgi:hypothetical protein
MKKTCFCQPASNGWSSTIRMTAGWRAGVLWFILPVFLIACHRNDTGDELSISSWFTMPDKSSLFELKDERFPFFPAADLAQAGDLAVITVDPMRTYQEMDGFGYTLTGGSALWISKMSDEARAELLRELFTTEDGGIGVSYLRVSVGSSDLDPYVFPTAIYRKGRRIRRWNISAWIPTVSI